MRRLSGATWAGLAFVAGTLFASCRCRLYAARLRTAETTRNGGSAAFDRQATGAEPRPLRRPMTTAQQTRRTPAKAAAAIRPVAAPAEANPLRSPRAAGYAR